MIRSNGSNSFLCSPCKPKGEITPHAIPPAQYPTTLPYSPIRRRFKAGTTLDVRSTCPREHTLRDSHPRSLFQEASSCLFTRRQMNISTDSSVPYDFMTEPAISLPCSLQTITRPEHTTHNPTHAASTSPPGIHRVPRVDQSNTVVAVKDFTWADRELELLSVNAQIQLWCSAWKHELIRCRRRLMTWVDSLPLWIWPSQSLWWLLLVLILAYVLGMQWRWLCLWAKNGCGR